MANDYWDLSVEELIKVRRRLAARANKQMQRWLAAGLGEKGAAYKQYAKPYLRQFGPDRATFHLGATPIAGKKANTYRQKQKEISEIAALERYTNAKTYSIKGYQEAKRKALAGLAQASGIEPGSEEMIRFLASAADDFVGTEQWLWVKWTLGSEAIKAVAKGIAQGTATDAEMIDRIKAMQLKETAGTRYSSLNWEDYMDELGLGEDHVSDMEDEDV